MDGYYDEFLDDLKDKYVEFELGDGGDSGGKLIGYSTYGVTMDWEYNGKKGRIFYPWGNIKSIEERRKNES